MIMKNFTCRPPLLVALVVALIVGSLGIALTQGRAQAQSSAPSLAVRPTNIVPVAVRAVEPTLATAAATPPTPPPAPNPVPPLPVPAQMPNPANRVALTEFGRIQIPKIGVDQIVHEGIEQMVIDAGPAHWPGTANFGSWGNVVLAGHRTTHSEPFLRAAELAAGDQIILSDAVGTYTYHVTGIEVVPNTKLSIVDQTPGRNLTIFTCHPIGSSTERLVVHAQLMSAPAPGQ
jgi:LPXTG-site transpeptidase (sortase) family protein